MVILGPLPSIGTSVVAVPPFEPRASTTWMPSPLTAGPVPEGTAVKGPPSTLTCRVTPSGPLTTTPVCPVNHPLEGTGLTGATVTPPVGSVGAAAAKKKPLFVLTATLPAASTACTKYSNWSPAAVSGIPPDQVDVVPTRPRSENFHVVSEPLRRATSTRFTVAVPPVSVTSIEKAAVPSTLLASMRVKAGGAKSLLLDRSTRAPMRV